MGHRKYENPQPGVMGFVPRSKPVQLFRSVDPGGLKRLTESIQTTGAPKFANKLNKSGEPAGENFFAEKRAYAEKFAKKGKRSMTMQVLLHPGTKAALLRNPRFAAAHDSVFQTPDFKHLARAKKGAREGILVKSERIGKGIASSVNYGFREGPAYDAFNRSIKRIYLLPPVGSKERKQLVFAHQSPLNAILAKRRAARAKFKATQDK
ncbi:hypothetical protein [Chitinimonas sp. JJ19]|uniref:hypothetical protein n=1 Tax=Chitinimonas sp. JJ19 TaxID=3109352 RepID=UPI003002322C